MADVSDTSKLLDPNDLSPQIEQHMRLASTDYAK